MPILNWLGKDKVINHHQQVPYRVLEPQYTYGQADSAGSPCGGNMIVHGDNLDALKALLPRFEGKVKLVYIDPPYNTGNENWVYNDNVNDPKITKWLGEVVGREGEDLSRHDKWLCMMYPRLRLLQRLLADDGAIFISIDDNEVANLRLICDEIFGSSNFMADIIWQHSVQSNGYGGNFVNQYNHTIVYRKSNLFMLLNLPRTEEDNRLYKNPDNDPRGRWRMGYCVNGLYRPNLKYDIVTPSGKIIPPPDKGWRWSKDTLEQKIEIGEIIFNENETSIIHKIYLDNLDGRVPTNLWLGDESGTTRSSNAELKKIFDGNTPFDTPKPTNLIERIIQISASPGDIILDSFAGSGTTAHAVLNMNKQDSGNRRFILVEMEDYADTITAERVKRVIDGYGSTEGTGGGFAYYELGDRLLLEDGNLNESLDLEKISEYVWYTETRSDYTPQDEQYLLGVRANTAYYFYYEKQRVTVLDHDFLHGVKTKTGSYLIYADINTLSAEEMDAANIRFKKIPRDITRL